jgi:autotransporter-associated beta strand protein
MGLSFQPGTDSTYAGPIEGSISVAKKCGDGILVLTGANTYTGTTDISSGNTLQVGDGGPTGTLGTGAVTNNGNLNFFRSDSITVPNDIAGSGTVTKSGAGTLILTGSNEYSGTTNINAGTLQIGSGSTAGFPGTGTFNNNGILAFSKSDTLTVPNAITGSGELRQTGSGTTVLTHDNCYTGQTTISSGTLQLGNGGTSGSPGTGDIVNNANLAFNRADYFIADNRITGSGSVNVNSGEFKLTNDNNDYSGITTIDSGAGLRIGYASSATGKPGTGAIINNGALDFDRSGSLSVGNAIGGTGSVTQLGTGTTNLTSSTLTWSGDTSAHDGKLVLPARPSISRSRPRLPARWTSMSSPGRGPHPAPPRS